MISQKEIFLSRGYNVPSFYFDADGRKVEIETKEDEEQSFRLDCIVKLLVRAGYYRAKIKGILPFDIVVGGIAWCIDSSDIDLDVDLLFEEGLSIGQKIALTEKIVVVLPKIKCPYFIEPHEIQGLNFIQIYPVIEWLINWSQENREKQAAYLKEYARNQYHKNFTNEGAEKFRQARRNSCASVQHVMEIYQPKRTGKQNDKSIKDIKLKLASTLGEYGITFSEQGGKNRVNPIRDLQLDVDHIVSLRQGLSKQVFPEEVLNFEDVFHLISSDYRSFDARKKLNQLNEELKLLEVEEKKLVPALYEEKKKRNELSASLNDKKVDMLNLNQDEQQIVLKIQKLIKDHEALREEEKNRKASLKQELSDLQTAISELENSTINEEVEHLQKQIDRLRKVQTYKKLELAEIARKVTSKERALERIPTRAELSQYQKRFLELYRIHTLKTAEAKHDIMTYNMLDNRLKFILKQINIVNSFQDSYSCVLSEGLNREAFFTQVEDIIAGVVKAKETIVLSKMKTDASKETLVNELKKLQDEKTAYAKAVNLLNTLYKKRHAVLETYERLNAFVGGSRAAFESA